MKSNYSNSKTPKAHRKNNRRVSDFFESKIYVKQNPPNMRILKIGAASTIIPGMAFIPLPVGLWGGRTEGFFLGFFETYCNLI